MTKALAERFVNTVAGFDVDGNAAVRDGGGYIVAVTFDGSWFVGLYTNDAWVTGGETTDSVSVATDSTSDATMHYVAEQAKSLLAEYVGTI